LIDDRDRAYFGRGSQEEDKIGFLEENTRAIFGRSYAAEPDILIEQLRKDEAIAETDTQVRTRNISWSLHSSGADDGSAFSNATPHAFFQP
jgi:hypothetical protein